MSRDAHLDDTNLSLGRSVALAIGRSVARTLGRSVASDGMHNISMGVPSSGTEGTQTQLRIDSVTSTPHRGLISLVSHSPQSRDTSAPTTTGKQLVAWLLGRSVARSQCRSVAMSV